MKKTFLFVLIAVIPLLVIDSCSQKALVPEPEPEAPVSVMIDPWLVNNPTDECQMVPGPVTRIQAGFVETKTHVEVNGTDTFAKVVWDADDVFVMRAYDSDGKKYYYADYTASSAGEKVTFTTSYWLPTTTKYHSIYAPLSPVYYSNEYPDFGFGLTVPTEQTATPGGVVKGLLYSYALSDHMTDDLTFHNMLALVRVRMTGSIASSVKSITLQGASALARDCLLVPGDDGTPVLTFAKKFGGQIASNTVTLSDGGSPLSADTDYYFAVVPGLQSSFTLIFSDGAGNSTTKIASKAVTFARGEINKIPTIDLGDAFTDPASPSLATIQWNTASAGAPKPVTLAVIPDGFTLSEMPKYEMLAKAAMNTLFSVEPFKSYKNYFNVYILKEPSNESGARISDGTLAEQTRDCYFRSTWPADSYSGMHADDDLVKAYVTAHCPDIINGTHTIQEVPTLLIINDSRYGGINRTWSTGEAYCMAPYSYEGGALSWSYPSEEAVSDQYPAYGYTDTPSAREAEVGQNTGTWLNTMVHEFGGHCFGRLADEYWYGPKTYMSWYPSMSLAEAEAESIKGPFTHIPGYEFPVLFRTNVSATYDNPGRDDTYGTAGWQFLLDMKPTLVATNPLYNRIGIYQGGNVSMLNVWRSERVSCMIDNRFYFSAFQRYLIVNRIMTLAGAPFDAATFWAKDNPADPVRDIVSSPVLGQAGAIPPRPVPMLPPPVVVE